jgi:hypothetical protein
MRWLLPYLTMLGCSSSRSTEISRSAVLGMPSSSVSRRMRLSATTFLVLRSSDLYTTPYVPSPMEPPFSMRWYRSMVASEKGQRWRSRAF